jgi:tRNA-Thr(GGU) m(6)t(6)A37 methyltransferase TsaA
LLPTLTLQPIGYLRTRQRVKFQAGHQPVAASAADNVLELLPGCGYEQALQDLAGMDRIWLLWWFHRNENWRPLVLPPRGPARRRGVFATRSPHRPNPLGLTAVPLLGVAGLELLLGPCDLVDGTPVLDIKPYLAAHDAFPDARAPWIDALDADARSIARFAVEFSGEAEAQLAWLREHHAVDFRARLAELLARDPTPHRTRRIRRRTPTTAVIGCGAWRAEFSATGDTVRVLAIEAAYPRSFLERPDYRDVPDRAAQLAFLARWPEHLPAGETAPESAAPASAPEKTPSPK